MVTFEVTRAITITPAIAVAIAFVAFGLFCPLALIKLRVWAFVAAGVILVGIIAYSAGVKDENLRWRPKWDDLEIEHEAALARLAKPAPRHHSPPRPSGLRDPLDTDTR
jgi:hypothetical protein